MYSNCSYVFVSIWSTLLIYVLFCTHWTGTYAECQDFRISNSSSMPSVLKNDKLLTLSIWTINGQWWNEIKFKLIFKTRTLANPLSSIINAKSSQLFRMPVLISIFAKFQFSDVSNRQYMYTPSLSSCYTNSFSVIATVVYVHYEYRHWS